MASDGVRRGYADTLRRAAYAFVHLRIAPPDRENMWISADPTGRTAFAA